MLGDAFKDWLLPFSIAGRRAHTRTLLPCTVPPDVPLHRWTARSRCCPPLQHGSSNAQRSGLRGHRHQGRRSVDGGMSSTPGPFTCVRIEALIQGRPISSGRVIVETVDTGCKERPRRGCMRVLTVAAQVTWSGSLQSSRRTGKIMPSILGEGNSRSVDGIRGHQFAGQPVEDCLDHVQGALRRHGFGECTEGRPESTGGMRWDAD